MIETEGEVWSPVNAGYRAMKVEQVEAWLYYSKGVGSQSQRGWLPESKRWLVESARHVSGSGRRADAPAVAGTSELLSPTTEI